MSENRPCVRTFAYITSESPSQCPSISVSSPFLSSLFPHCSGRALVKRGRIHIIVINDKGKQVKSRALEFFLLTDLLIYAKPHGKGSKTTAYVVYKVVHRSLVEARPAHQSDAPNVAAAFKNDDCMMELLLFGSQTVRLCVRAQSETDRCGRV